MCLRFYLYLSSIVLNHQARRYFAVVSLFQQNTINIIGIIIHVLLIYFNHSLSIKFINYVSLEKYFFSKLNAKTL